MLRCVAMAEVRTTCNRSGIPRHRARLGGARWALLLSSGLLGTMLGTCARQPGPPQDPPPARTPAASAASTNPTLANDIFVDVAAPTGLDFFHFNGMSGELYLSEITCGGGALFDFDNDGDLDVYLAQGTMRGGKSLAAALVQPRHPPPLTDRLYRNDLAGSAGGQELRFTDVTARSGFAPGSYGCAAAVGDFDNDGWPDLYLPRLGANQMLRNQGDGTFRDQTQETRTGDLGSGVAATFFDYDRDGWLDLYLVNNVTFSDENPPRCRSLTGAPDYCGPGSYAFEPDRLWHNRGDGTFEDVTVRAGLAGVLEPGLGVVAADFNGDRWPDVYVANDGRPNNLWINQKDGTFSDWALLAGCAVNRHGQSEASMGVDAGDYDSDGDLDLFMTHLIKETNTLYQNDGQGMFEDRTADSGLGPPSLPFTSFGTGWIDYDNDGWLDLLVVNGAVTLLPELARQGDPFPLHQTRQLFRNLGQGRFVEVTAGAGAAFQQSEVGRGLLFGDVDNDGALDAVVVNNNGPVRLLQNQAGRRAAWLGLRLIGREPPRDMLGAEAAVLRQGKPPLWRRVRSDGSYCAANDPRVLFGLGDDPRVDRVLVRWPDGTSETWSGIPSGQYTTLRQGSGERAAPDLARTPAH